MFTAERLRRQERRSEKAPGAARRRALLFLVRPAESIRQESTGPTFAASKRRQRMIASSTLSFLRHTIKLRLVFVVDPARWPRSDAMNRCDVLGLVAEVVVPDLFSARPSAGPADSGARPEPVGTLLTSCSLPKADPYGGMPGVAA